MICFYHPIQHKFTWKSNNQHRSINTKSDICPSIPSKSTFAFSTRVPACLNIKSKPRLRIRTPNKKSTPLNLVF